MRAILWCVTIFLLGSCAGLAEAVQAGGEYAVSRAPEIGGAISSGPILGLYEIGATLVGAGLAGYAAYERTRRKRAENGT